MKRMLKQSALVWLAVILMLAMIPAGAFAAEVASVGGSSYDSFAAAVSAAKDGDTITLLQDTESGKVTIDKNITLNLNNKKLTVKDPADANYGIVIKKQLTINGSGSVHVAGTYGIGLSTSCTGGLTINGGTFTSADGTYYMIGAFAGKVKINGGTFTTPYCVVNSFDGYNASVEITGGSFAITDTSDSTAAPLLGIDFAVSGGKFSMPIPAEYCADGYVLVVNSDGTYGVAIPQVVSYSAPKTGDSSHLMLWAALMAMAAIGMVVISRKRLSADR